VHTLIHPTILTRTSTYNIKKSFEVIKDLKECFAVDAKLMYTNIDTANGIETLKDFLNDNKDNLPKNFPTALFIKILVAVMSNNVFSFSMAAITHCRKPTEEASSERSHSVHSFWF
jgi:hypothetical protein